MKMFASVTVSTGFFLLSSIAITFARPALFFYPPSYVLPDGTSVASPVTVAKDEITNLFPAIPEMDGVVLILYWSQLCPTERQCDFKTIDDVLSYWHRRGKKVVLSIATIGFPMTTIIRGKVLVTTATPGWLLARTHNYTEPVRLIGSPSHQESLPTILPRYDDPQFTIAVQELVSSLSRYDGNPALSQVRISTGLLGEDSPSPDGYTSKMPDFSPTLWIDYCQRMLKIYGDTFHKTQIEFDIGWISWLAVIGGIQGRHLADRFVSELYKRRVMLAFNGLQSDSLAQLSRSDTGPAASLAYLQMLSRRGSSIGLEAFEPMQASSMSDVDAMITVIKRLQPQRLVFFGSEATTLQASKGVMSGTAAHANMKQPSETIDTAANRVIRLIDGL